MKIVKMLVCSIALFVSLPLLGMADTPGSSWWYSPCNTNTVHDPCITETESSGAVIGFSDEILASDGISNSLEIRYKMWNTSEIKWLGTVNPSTEFYPNNGVMINLNCVRDLQKDMFHGTMTYTNRQYVYYSVLVGRFNLIHNNYSDYTLITYRDVPCYTPYQYISGIAYAKENHISSTPWLFYLFHTSDDNIAWTHKLIARNPETHSEIILDTVTNTSKTIGWGKLDAVTCKSGNIYVAYEWDGKIEFGLFNGQTLNKQYSPSNPIVTGVYPRLTADLNSQTDKVFMAWDEDSNPDPSLVRRICGSLFSNSQWSSHILVMGNDGDHHPAFDMTYINDGRCLLVSDYNYNSGQGALYASLWNPSKPAGSQIEVFKIVDSYHNHSISCNQSILNCDPALATVSGANSGEFYLIWNGTVQNSYGQDTYSIVGRHSKNPGLSIYPMVSYPLSGYTTKYYIDTPGNIVFTQKSDKFVEVYRDFPDFQTAGAMIFNTPSFIDTVQVYKSVFKPKYLSYTLPTGDNLIGSIISDFNNPLSSGCGVFNLVNNDADISYYFNYFNYRPAGNEIFFFVPYTSSSNVGATLIYGKDKELDRCELDMYFIDWN
jgi:hypothetical protein